MTAGLAFLAAAGVTSIAGVAIENRSSVPVQSVLIQSDRPLANGHKSDRTAEFVYTVGGELRHAMVLLPGQSGRPVFHGSSVQSRCVFDVTINLSPGTKYLPRRNLCAGKPIIVTDADRAMASAPAASAAGQSTESSPELTPLDAPSWELLAKDQTGQLGYLDTDRISGDAATKFITYKQVRPSTNWAAVIRARISCASWTWETLEGVAYPTDGSHHFLKIARGEKPIIAGTVMDAFAQRACR